MMEMTTVRKKCELIIFIVSVCKFSLDFVFPLSYEEDPSHEREREREKKN